MRSRSGIRKNAARRFATVMAAVGALLVSSGLALMAAPSPADAHAAAGGSVVQKDKPPKEPRLKDWVCKYVGTPGVNEHLKKGNDGLVWVSTSATQGTWFQDAQGRSYVLVKDAPHKPKPDASQCPAPAPNEDFATASVDFVDPTCENDNAASYETAGEHVVFKVKIKAGDDEGDALVASEPVSVSPGSYVKITAKAIDHYRFEDGSKKMVFEHTFGEAITNCSIEAYADVQWIEPSCGTKADFKTKSGDPVDVTWSAPSATPAPGVTVTLTATALDGYTFGGKATQPFTHTYDTVVPPTGQTYDPVTGVCAAPTTPLVSPPTTTPTTQVSPPKAHVKAHVKAETKTPTVVHAGLVTTSSDHGVEAGLGLVLAGLLLLAGAGGLVVVEGGERKHAA